MADNESSTVNDTATTSANTETARKEEGTANTTNNVANKRPRLLSGSNNDEGESSTMDDENNNQQQRAMTVTASSSQVESSTTSDKNNEQQRATNDTIISSSQPLDSFNSSSSYSSCGNCILCRMPRCKRCFICVNTMDEKDGGEERTSFCLRKVCSICVLLCIYLDDEKDFVSDLVYLTSFSGWDAKMCCSIPIEHKLQGANELGFPPGWKYCFDDPHKASLVYRPPKRVLSNTLAGLTILSPDGKVFHSLESAFGHMPHSSISDAIKMVQKFLAHVGSSLYDSVPDHFLVGRNYCIEFTNSQGVINILYGKVMACMRPQTISDNEMTTSGHEEGVEEYVETKSFFIIEYNPSMAKDTSMKLGVKVPTIQMITSEAVWGGCISYERRIHCRRDANSVIRSIDQATAVETWIAPDVRIEDLVEHQLVDDIGMVSLPQLTIFSRGYKFVFSVRVKSSTVPVKHHSAADGEKTKDHSRGSSSKQEYGVFASCTTMHDGSTTTLEADQELNLKPGELIDLGLLSPLQNEDKKSLPAFIVKNYCHHLKVGRWNVVSGEDNVVYDLTNDQTGMLHDVASKRVLSYVRKRQKGDAEVPSMHLRLDPCGQVHMLFGILYEGNWFEYEKGIQSLVPLFCGREMEVIISRYHGLGNKQMACSKYLQSIGMFQSHDIVESTRQLMDMFLHTNGGGEEEGDGVGVVDKFHPSVIDRSRKAVTCLVERTEKLQEVLTSNNDSSSVDNKKTACLDTTLAQLHKLASLLESVVV